jgi:hypothetical protein
VAEAAAGRWTFRRAGFWHARVIVSLAGSDSAVAVFTARWMGTGTLELSAGRQVHWSAAHAWQADDGTPLVEFTGRQTLIKLEGTVALTPAAVGRPDLALLVLLGWYLVVLQVRDTHHDRGTGGRHHVKAGAVTPPAESGGTQAVRAVVQPAKNTSRH